MVCSALSKVLQVLFFVWGFTFTRNSFSFKTLFGFLFSSGSSSNNWCKWIRIDTKYETWRVFLLLLF